MGSFAGGIATGSLRGALVGAFSAAAFYGVGEAFEGVNVDFGQPDYFKKDGDKFNFVASQPLDEANLDQDDSY